ncbi:carboxyesterase [Punctularia strigosozonata HHB-11173 SS5]|uniref:Carboxylic ester hydrolase n=1 Tax=Punctularia strigosozonata (strain HHB-11173) TaxID=741275 RepID=R7S1J7_PUNST|nr:carboxyesterase [Punctularia strigosozonata HHB-11173 SS5]EIN04230.1 carboxyesterase [Punctularia strigosozonata HHB-11173 SS5]
MLLELAAVLGLSTLCAALASPGAPSPEGPIVDLGYVKLLGHRSEGVDFFGGIRYVQPPLGNLRFRAPVMLDEKTRAQTVTDARNWGDICIQQPASLDLGSEDCLTLNVWTPPHAKEGDKLRVALYIHGGGNYYAVRVASRPTVHIVRADFYQSAQGFPMNTWVTGSGGSIVAVNIQYRLGLLGFLAAKDVMENGSVNNGLLDQRAAIAWVKRHISKFGGDPNQITLAGESAGGADLIWQMIAYGGQQKPDFQGIIAQSIGTDPTPTEAQYESCYANVTAATNCTLSTGADTLACLRAAPLSAIVDAVNTKPSTCKFLPVIDGDLIQDLPSTMLREGRFSKVNFVGGHCTDDGSIFVGDPATFTNTTDGFVSAIKKRYTMLSNATVQRMIDLYPESEFGSQWERAEQAFGDTVFTCQDWYIADKLYKAGQKHAYNYRFNTPDPVQLAQFPWKKVMHTSDLFFLFQGTNSGPYPGVASHFAPFNGTEQALATETIGYWTSFARAFDPSTFRARGAPAWPDMTHGRLVIQEGRSFIEQRTAKYIERCNFWNEVGDEIRV